MSQACAEWHGEIGAYVVGALSRAEAGQVRHLRRCVGCRADYQDLAPVRDRLDRVPSGLCALILTGPAGIGKTTVWREGVRLAEARGYLVLPARPGRAERSLSFAGLAGLLGPVGRAAFDALVPRRVRLRRPGRCGWLRRGLRRLRPR
jgi:hypothetical protein